MKPKTFLIVLSTLILLLSACGPAKNTSAPTQGVTVTVDVNGVAQSTSLERHSGSFCWHGHDLVGRHARVHTIGAARLSGRQSREQLHRYLCTRLKIWE